MMRGNDGNESTRPARFGRMQTRPIKLFALILALLVGLCSSIAIAYGEDASSLAADEVALSAPSSEPKGTELEGKRTATSATYALPDGQRETRIYQAPINYRDDEGDWTPITEGFKSDGSALEDRSHPFEIHLPSQVGSGPVRFEAGEQWISFELAGGDSGPAKLEPDGTVSYEVPDAKASFEYATLPEGVKETVELQGPSSPARIDYELTAAPGITPELLEDGSIVFLGEDGKAVAVMPAPTVSDASTIAPDPKHVSYSLSTEKDGAWSLAVEVDRAWLEASDRKWPVLVDPTLLSAEGAGTSSCVLAMYDPYRKVCLPDLEAIETYSIINGTLKYWYSRSLLNFDLSAIPTTAEIHDASVNLYKGDPYYWKGEPSGVELKRVTTSWGSPASWNCASYTGETCNPWTTPGADHNSEGSVLTTSKVTGPWWKFSSGLTPVFQGWVNGNAKAGLLLKLKDECNCHPQREVEFEGPKATATKRPYAQVLYLPKAPSSSKVTSPTEGTRTARRLKVKAGWEVPGVTGVTFQFRDGKEGKFEDLPLGLTREASSAALESWPIKVSGEKETKPLYFDAAHASTQLQKEGGPIYLRAVFDGLGAEANGYSDPVEAVVNRITGGPHDATTGVGPGTLDLETGNLSISRADVSIPGFNSALEFTRSYNSRAPKPVTESEKAEPPSVLGPGWKTGIPVEEAGGSEWRNVRKVVDTGSFKEETGEICKFSGPEEEIEECEPEIVEVPYKFVYAVVTANEGGEISFEETSENVFATPSEMTGWTLVKTGGKFALSDPSGSVTTFSNESTGGGDEYLPVSINQPGGSGNSTRLVWDFKGEQKQLKKLIAPSPPGLECKEVTKEGPSGCHALAFNYAAVASAGERLSTIEYFAPGNASASVVAKYEYDTEGRLIAEWDPRVPVAQPLKEKYTYGASGQLTEVTPPGQEPWKLTYGTVDEEAGVGRLVNVKRASLLASPTEAQTTIAYNVPVAGGSGAPDLSGTAIAQWGQQDVPVEATAIFPPSEVPSTSPPSSYAQATIYYMDSEGYEVNTAMPKGGGTSSASITTAETDEYGNVVRELTPVNRLAVLAKPEAEREKTWKALETKRQYNEQGTQMVEEWGPMHPVKIAETGESKEARLHTVIEYDDKWPGAGVKPHLPTRETTGANNPALWGVDKDQQVTETKYNWNLRKPTETIVDAGSGHLNIKSVTVYDETTGLPLERRQPKSATESSSPGTTKIVYYSPSAASPCNSTLKAGLPCQIRSGAQTSGSGRPELLVKRFGGYNSLAEPTSVYESPNDEASNYRSTITNYDGAGRPLTQKIYGGGTELPKTETEYNEKTGLPVAQRFVCEGVCPNNFEYSSSFGAFGTGNGQFNHPADVALDAGRNLWVVDKANNRIEQFNENREFMRAVGSSGSTGGKLSSPSGIAIDSSGYVLVTDTANNRVARFTQAGVFDSVIGANVNKTKVESGGTLAEKNHCTAASGNVCQAGTSGSAEGQMKEPIGIAAAGSNFFVVEKGNNRVEKFNPNGELLAKFGSLGSAAGQLKEPTAIGTGGPSGVLWVADTGNNRIQEWNSSLAFVRQVGAEGSGDGQFKAPSAIEVDSNGLVYVGDQNNQRVQFFGPNGEFVYKFGTAGSGSGQFNFSAPIGLVADGKGAVWVTDAGNNRVQRWSFFDSESTSTAYNALGQPTSYTDADGKSTTIIYDINGRLVKITDAKGSQTTVYDSTSGLLTELKDSAAGTFTATYDADGNLKTRGLPNGLTATTAYNAAGQPTGLTYTKEASCGESCTWYAETLERSIYGQILSDNGTLANETYSYDRAGRLLEAGETPTGGTCTSRAYTYDLDSNRLSKTTRSLGIPGPCPTTGGTEQKYTYDKADRLEGPTYDSWGRITSLPAEFAGGKVLTTSYYSTEMVASQEQNGIKNTFLLDASGRQRQRLQGPGGLEGSEIFHYDSPSDSPAWTERGTSWTRSIAGIGGELAAVQDSATGLMFNLTDIHGDVVATAEPSPTATKLKATSRYDEFGNPVSGAAGRFGWLGGKQRRTELPSGVIQMGARSYVPAIGRFLTPDPIPGGSANAYDYANQDPVNLFDLTGSYVEACGSPNAAWTKRCKRQMKKRERSRAKSVSRRSVTIVLIERRGGGARASGIDIGGALEDALDYVHDKVGGGVKKIGNGFASLTLSGPEFRAAGKAFTLANAWSPDRLIQAWQCGEYLAGAGRGFGDCDPWEMWNGAPPDSAR